MAWNTEETRQRLKEAAVAEFAAHGLAGTRMEKIAARAGINKERLYKYFGNKEQLFTVVLSDELAKIAAAVPLESVRSDDIGEYAGRCFDYHVDHPDLVRLLHWEALEFDGAVPDEQERTQHYRSKVAVFRAAQDEGILAPDVPPAELVFLVTAMAAWWAAVPQVARMISGAAPTEDAIVRQRQRTAVVAAARAMGLTHGTD